MAFTVRLTPSTVMEPSGTETWTTSGGASTSSRRASSRDATRHDGADPVHVTLDEVPAEPVADPQGPLEVDPAAGTEVPEPGPVERGADDVRREAAGHHSRHRETCPIHRHALAGGSDPGRRTRW